MNQIATVIDYEIVYTGLKFESIQCIQFYTNNIGRGKVWAYTQNWVK